MANPKVEMRPVTKGGMTTAYVVWCVTGECRFTNYHSLKTAAQTIQRDHARYHRMRQQERRALNRPEGS